MNSGIGYGRRAAVSCLYALAAAAGAVYGEEITLGDAPLYLVEGVEPNILVNLDNSNSMAKGYLPDGMFDGLAGGLRTVLLKSRRMKSSHYNRLYYDPSVTYEPGLDAGGASLGEADFHGAWEDPFHPRRDSCTVDLSKGYRAIEYYNGHCVDAGGNPQVIAADYLDDPEPDLDNDGEPIREAYYYEYDESAPDCGKNAEDDDCYVRVTVGPDEQQNFANWYSYYRNRMRLAKTAISRTFGGLKIGARLSYMALTDDPTTTGSGSDESNPSTLMSIKGSPVVEDFLGWLFELNPSGFTPLQASMVRAGELFGEKEAYLKTPGKSYDEDENPVWECRKNFHLLFTDGVWETPVVDSRITGNVDADRNIDIQSNDYGVGTYPAMFPYADKNTAFLADAAFYFWVNDLVDDLDNTVPPSITDLNLDVNGNGSTDDYDTFWNPKNDPATWQHMVTYTIGLGVEGDLDSTDPAVYQRLFATGFPGAGDGTTSKIETSISAADRVDDLWHAAINSRGRYFNAQRPNDLIKAFGDILAAFVEKSDASSSAAAALNSGFISTDSVVVQALFNSTDWNGRLLAYPVFSADTPCSVSGKSLEESADGDICKDADWDAAVQLRNQGAAGRSIITFDPDTAMGGEGTPMAWDDLSTRQQDALIADKYTAKMTGEEKTAYRTGDGKTEGKSRILYLYGDTDNEQKNGGTYRNRTGPLGDIINSSPLYVGQPSRTYPDDLEGVSYSDFKARARTALVYVGANDGMLHAFKAADGHEVFGYVPDAVFPNLYQLTKPAYPHHSYVDGQLAEGDVFLGSWKTVLVGGLGLGGQGYFALDITDPGGADDLKELPLWEFTDRDAPDLGYTYGRAAIVRVKGASGTYWAAVVGNGYNNTEGFQSTAACTDGDDTTYCPHSATGDAVLYVINLGDGSFTSISTGVGSAQDPRNTLAGTGYTGKTHRPNGLASPTVADLDNDFVADIAYAGDLFGNLWKFDLHSMKVAEVGGEQEPLFAAVSEDGWPQPISSGVEVMRHPTGVGTLVLFGTGKYLGMDDVTDKQTQTFYAVWDDGGNARSNIDFERGDSADSGLLEQKVLLTDRTSFSGVDVRITSDNPIDWSRHAGWFIDLPEKRERVRLRPQVRDRRVVFLTMTPSGNPCIAGGSSWAMALDAGDGSRLKETAFDVDGKVATNDMLDYEKEAGGEEEPTVITGLRKENSGIYYGPAAMVLGEGQTMNFISTSKGKMITLREFYRQLWRVWQEVD